MARTGSAARSISLVRQRCSSRSSGRSEEHTSELQSLAYLVCRLLLEKKKHTRTCPPREGNTLNPRPNVSSPDPESTPHNETTDAAVVAESACPSGARNQTVETRPCR